MVEKGSYRNFIGGRVELSRRGKWLHAAADVHQVEPFLLRHVLPWLRERSLSAEICRFNYEIHRSVDEGDSEDPWIWTASFRIAPPKENQEALLNSLAESFHEWSVSEQIYGYHIGYSDVPSDREMA